MKSAAAWAVAAMVLAGCGATSEPATTSAAAFPAPSPRPEPAPPPAPPVAGGAAATSPAGPDAELTAACAAAFEDQRRLYVGDAIDVHPERKAAFLRTCATMPPAFQRCASPLHQIEHEAECAAVHDIEDRAARAAWHRTFDLLSDPRPDLPPGP